MKRRKTRQIRVGGVKVGGGAPVSIQSMTKVDTSNVKAAVCQIRELENAGCEIVRLAIKTHKDAHAIKEIKRKVSIPLVADIHFDHRLALEAIKSGVDKIRINPGNMRNVKDAEEVVRAAKKARIPIRIGVNSGSVTTPSTLHPTPKILVNSAIKYVKLFEQLGFHDIIISLKASDVVTTVDAYKSIAKLCDYPLHLGVTASGSYDLGIVKSSIGIGALLMDGIGDTIRVSLTADPVEEVGAAKRILSSLGLRNFGPQILSCPTCGRCQVDLCGVVKKLEYELSAFPGLPFTKAGAGSHQLSAKKPISIAVMGCEVNGPGEAVDADIGIAAGKGSGILFKKGKMIKRIKEKDFVKEVVKLLKLTAES